MRLLQNPNAWPPILVTIEIQNARSGAEKSTFVTFLIIWPPILVTIQISADLSYCTPRKRWIRQFRTEFVRMPEKHFKSY